MVYLVSLCACLLFVIVLSTCHVIPRLSFPMGSPGRSLTVFTNPDVYNTTTLLLSNNEDTLFVGARDTVLSIDVSQTDTMTMKKKMDWSPSEKDLADCSMKGKMKPDCYNFVRVLQVLNSTHMYTCGTFAFSPRCIYINVKTFSMALGPSGKPEEGRGRCPYDPYQKNTAITVDGELYTGTVADYRGNRPVISRHLSEGSHVDLKLDDTLGWLEDPTFISSTYIPSEEKVYFFFSETGREYDFIDKFTVSRIAQVCTSDVGGQRTLQRRWTTFAKAQLLCQADQELPYNVLQDIVTLPPPEGTSEDETLFYGIFSSQWQVNLGRSAVCAFSLKSIKEVFGGNYKVLNRDTLKWSTRLQEKMANPGECGLHNASDNTLRFVKENFLADKNVPPVTKGLSMVSPDQSYSNIAAQRVRGAHGRDYTVLYLLTDSGYLHKAVVLEKGAHIIEEIQVFHQPQLVKNLLISISKGVVLIGSSEGVVSVPVSNCSYYWSCAECILARDPFCGWDPVMKVCTEINQNQLVQDVDGGNVSDQCKSVTPRSRSGQGRSPSAVCPPGEVVSVSLNEVVHLLCPKASHLAKRHWERPNSQLSSKIYIQPDNGSLSFVATPSTLGHYLCQSEENGYTQTLIVYHVKQKSNPTIPPVTPSRSQSTLAADAGSKDPVSTNRWMTPTRAEPKPKTEEPEPTVAYNDTPAVTTQKSRNFTRWFESEVKKSRMSEPGENLQLADKPSYLQELVVVSVLLALCVSALLTIALYKFQQPCHSRTVPQTPSSCRDAERGRAATPQERETLRGHSPHGEKRNGKAPNGRSHNGQTHNGKSPITLSNSMLNGSNGHLPNTPI
ncbi:semaphorin-4A-like isoform X1 [Xyrauchen texanus]|uniref:semaphorin-4A-like isoform X1 n=1 Tax=Xyrauchen texanus TaxID=154827 RepID=UPI0022424ABE|nr:semaphorin-4A-like isoform X1 [Xyrauchen texanus]XP_051992054.1 semaphorin-4A-like isoform X1 [Xyrauchen texanus]